MGCLGREGEELPLEEQREVMETQVTVVPADGGANIHPQPSGTSLSQAGGKGSRT